MRGLRRQDLPPQGEAPAGRRGLQLPAPAAFNPLSPFGTASPEEEHLEGGLL